MQNIFLHESENNPIKINKIAPYCLLFHYFSYPTPTFFPGAPLGCIFMTFKSRS